MLVSLYQLTDIPTPPIPPTDAPQGGGNDIEFDPSELHPDYYGIHWDTDEAWRSAVLAWELGEEDYKVGQQVSFNQFAHRAFQASGEEMPDTTAMKGVITAIDAERVIRRKEKLIRIAKYTVVIGGVTYVLWRVVAVLLI